MSKKLSNRVLASGFSWLSNPYSEPHPYYHPHPHQLYQPNGPYHQFNNNGQAYPLSSSALSLSSSLAAARPLSWSSSAAAPTTMTMSSSSSNNNKDDNVGTDKRTSSSSSSSNKGSSSYSFNNNNNEKDSGKRKRVQEVDAEVENVANNGYHSIDRGGGGGGRRFNNNNGGDGGGPSHLGTTSLHPPSYPPLHPPSYHLDDSSNGSGSSGSSNGSGSHKASATTVPMEEGKKIYQQQHLQQNNCFSLAKHFNGIGGVNDVRLVTRCNNDTLSSTTSTTTVADVMANSYIDNSNNDKENDLYKTASTLPTLPSGNKGMSSLSSKTSLHPSLHSHPHPPYPHPPYPHHPYQPYQSQQQQQHPPYDDYDDYDDEVADDGTFGALVAMFKTEENKKGQDKSEQKAPFNSNNKKRLSDDIPKASNETTTTTTTNANITATGQATASTPKKKRQQYSDETKIKVLLALETRPGTRLCDIAREFDIAAPTISGWRAATASTPKKKRKRQQQYSDATMIQVLLALETRPGTRLCDIAREFDIPASTIAGWRAATASTPKKKRKRQQQYSVGTKIQVLLALETRPGTPLYDIAREFDIPVTTIAGWRDAVVEEKLDKNTLTVLNPDGKTFEICNDLEVNERNKFRTEVLVSEEKTGGLSRVIAEDGTTDLSEFGLYKLKNVYPEATADIYSAEMKLLDESEFSNPDNATSTVQLVGEYPIDPKKLEPLLAHRIKVSKSGEFGETPTYTDSVKVQKYNGSGGRHRDHKFKNLINKRGIPKSSFLLARVLEKTNGGVFQWFRESDGKDFLIDIKKGEFLIMMAHAGLCQHNSEEGLYTIVTDFVLPYDVIRRERDDNGGVDGKCEQMIRKFAKEISQH